MKVRVYDEYGALNSREVFSAFKTGLYENGDEQTKSFKDADVAVIWSVLFQGRMAPNREIWVDCIRSGKPCVVLEVGALKRGVTWKVGIGGINRKATFVKPFEENRFENLGLHLDPWKTGEGFVTIFTQRPDSQQWEGMCSTEEWVADTIQDIRKHTDRKILVRPHPRDRITDWNKLKGLGVYFAYPQQVGHDMFDHQRVFDATYAAINYSSGPSIQTAIAGIHTLCSSESLAYDVAETYQTIDNPLNKDRTEWAQMLAHTEWTTEEIKKGIPWCHLRKVLNQLLNVRQQEKSNTMKEKEMKTPQEISDYKARWKPNGFAVPVHSDLDWRAKDWCRKNLQRWQWSMDTFTGVYEHTFFFEKEEHAKEFQTLWAPHH